MEGPVGCRQRKQRREDLLPRDKIGSKEGETTGQINIRENGGGEARLGSIQVYKGR